MATERRTVVFCPRCGSTNASSVDDAHVPPGYTSMACGHCSHAAYCDEWELKFQWNTYLSLAPDAPLPRFVFTHARLVAAARSIVTRAHTINAGDDDSFAAEPAVRALCDAASDAWNEPHRHYHAMQHLAECLRWLDDPKVRAAVERPFEVELAVYLHDLVYDTTRSDNEEVSADRAVALLSAIDGADHAAIDRVRQMVLATKTHATEEPDTRVMLDVDLSILGAEEARFAEYEAQIREEFQWVPDEAYRAGRRRALEGFADRPRIFHSAALFEALESRARENLRRALS